MRVLLTRPTEDARRLTEVLRARGIEAVSAPLLDIEYIAGDALNLHGVQALLFTSANGVRAFAHRSDDRALPALCVGDATARQARDAGFTDVRSAGGDVDDLAMLVGASLDAGAGTLLHAAGSRVAGDLAGLLAAVGFTYRRDLLYRATKAERLPDAARAALEAGDVDGVLLYSPRTGAAFAKLVAEAGLAGRLDGVTAYCLSPAVADAVRHLPWASVRVAQRPEQEALLALLA